MRLEIQPIDDRNIKVVSKNTGNHAGNIILDGLNEWVFKPNDCGCVWTVDTIYELGELLTKMNTNK